MSAPGSRADVQAPSAQAEPLTLAALRSAGAERFDPVRLHYLERLSQRAEVATGALRGVLQGKLQEALAHTAERLHQRMQQLPTPTVPASGGTPLARLNQYIRDASASGRNDGSAQAPAVHRVVDGNARPEMKSVQRFRETWSRIAAVDQVDQALVRGPENAGPLNSHMLVLRSLASMRELSPEYLRRFLSQVDTLLWLDQASEPVARGKGKAVKRVRQKK